METKTRKRKERQPKVYEIVNIHPVYASKEEEEASMREAALEYYQICKRHGMVKKCESTKAV